MRQFHTKRSLILHWPAWLSALAFASACSGCNSTPEPKDPNNNTSALTTVPTASVGNGGAGDPATLANSQRQEGGCVIGGCSGELCQEPGAGEPGFSNCQYKREYECYKTAKCARGTDGACGWVSTPELDKCLKKQGG